MPRVGLFGPRLKKMTHPVDVCKCGVHCRARVRFARHLAVRGVGAGQVSYSRWNGGRLGWRRGSNRLEWRSCALVVGALHGSSGAQ